MNQRVVAASGLLAVVALGVLTVGAETQVGTVLAGGPEVRAMEDRAALASTASTVGELAGAYLDREQPGLASAVIEKAPLDVRERPEIAQLQARALFGRGRAREALAVARDAYDRCDTPAGIVCAPWLVAKSSRQVAFLEELVAAGVEDPRDDPSATQAAFERSRREVQLVAMR